jgi:hypothetical protein
MLKEHVDAGVVRPKEDRADEFDIQDSWGSALRVAYEAGETRQLLTKSIAESTGVWCRMI